jgi:hypothetical protein
MTPVDTSADAVVSVDPPSDGRYWYSEASYRSLQLAFIDLERRLADIESLLAARNVQNAAAFTASDAYQKRCESGDALLREARVFAADHCGVSDSAVELVAQIDAHLAGEDTGRGK